MHLICIYKKKKRKTNKKPTPHPPNTLIQSDLQVSQIIIQHQAEGSDPFTGTLKFRSRNLGI